MTDDEVLSGELVAADQPATGDVEPPIVRRGDPRCDAETYAENAQLYGRIRMSVRARCDMPPDHRGQHRVTLPDRITVYRW